MQPNNRTTDELNCASGAECLTWDEGDGFPVSVRETDPVSGLCPACLLQRAKMALNCCTPEDEARDDRVLTVLERALRGDAAETLVRRQIEREREKLTNAAVGVRLLHAVGATSEAERLEREADAHFDDRVRGVAP